MNATGDFLVEERLEDSVIVFGSGDLEDLLKIIHAYKDKGFNFVWYGEDNSTLCLGKVEEC
jgi:hypothetical protein